MPVKTQYRVQPIEICNLRQARDLKLEDLPYTGKRVMVGGYERLYTATVVSNTSLRIEPGDCYWDWIDKRDGYAYGIVDNQPDGRVVVGVYIQTGEQ